MYLDTFLVDQTIHVTIIKHSAHRYKEKQNKTGICGGSRVDRAQVEEEDFSDTEMSAPQWTRAPDYPLLLDCFNWESNQTNTQNDSVAACPLRMYQITLLHNLFVFTPPRDVHLTQGLSMQDSLCTNT